MRNIAALLAVLLVATMLGAGGCTPAATVAQELVVATGTDASTFDPHFTTDSATEVLNKNIYNNLVRFNDQMQIVPDLATKWDVAQDGLTWTFELRQGVKFHDGTNFDAHAVKAVLERVLNPEVGSPRRSVLAMISGIVVVDAHKVQLVTSYRCGSFLQQLAHPVGAMISPAAIEQYGKDLARNPVGTGPFKLTEWVSGDKIVMERNTAYFDGAPRVEKLVFRIVPEDATRAMLLEAGQVDVALRLPVTDLNRLRQNKDLTVIETPTVMTMYIALNNTRGPLADPRVRQAMNHAVDKNIIVRDIMEGMAIVADAPISPATWGYASIGAYSPDLAKARQLLAVAGYPNGFEVELWTPVGRYLMDRQIAENLQAQLAQVGINMKIQQWEFQALMSEVQKGQFDMVLLGWSPSTGDADQGLYPVFHSTQWPPRSNRAHYSNPEVDSLLERAREAVDPVLRLSLYQQAQQLIVNEAAWIFLHYPKQAVVTRSAVRGLEVLPVEHVLFTKVTK